MGYSAGSNSDGKTIVIGRVGALCGNVHLISGRAWITDNALKIKHLRGFEPEYLAIQLKLIDLNRFANANAQPLITGGTVKEQRVLQVSREEQYRIVQAVQQVTSTADVAINSIRREIDLLREYRTRLIADVVTGKLDVREAAAQLPEETDAPEPSEVADAFDEPEEAAEVEDATESEEMEA